MVNPPSGVSGNVTVTFSGSVTYGIVVGAANFAGVDQSDPFDEFASAVGSNTGTSTISVDVASDVNDLVFDVVFLGGSPVPTATAGSGQTQLWNATSDRAGGTASIALATATTTSMSYSATAASGTYYWAIAAVPINPAAVGPTHNLTMAVSPSGTGSTSPAVGVHAYVEGTVVNISAIPNSGYQFDHWTGDVADPDSASTTVTMNSDKTVTAYFVEAPPSGEVTLDGAVSTGAGDPNESSVSFSHTTGSGTDRLMLVGVSWNCGTTNRTISSITFTPSGGSAVGLTEVITQLGYNTSNPRYSAIYSLLNPGSGVSGTVDITFSGAVSNGIIAGAANFAGVDQTTPLGTPDGASGSGTSSSGTPNPSLSLTGLNGDELVFDNVFIGASSTSHAISADSGQTALWNILGYSSSNTSFNTIGAASTEQAAGTSVTMSWTTANYGTTTTRWAVAAVPINPAEQLPPSGSATSSATPSNATPSIGQQIDVEINIDVSGVNPPDNALGSFSASLDWNSAVLAYHSNSGLQAGFTGVVNPTTGHLAFNGANPSGATGNFTVLSITFDVVGTGTSSLDLGYSAMAAASTFGNLLPLLTVNDGQVVVSSSNHTVTFNANGGSGTMADQVANVPTALNANSFTRAGYTFAGWNTADDGSGVAYGDGATYSFAADITLYAQWTMIIIPPLPSSFYGQIHIYDNTPAVGDIVEAYVPGVVNPVASTTIINDSGLVYTFNVPGDDGSGPKDGGVEGDLITFKISGRIVATYEWHSGTNVQLNFHPPEAVPGGPYNGTAGIAINFAGSANDWGSDAVTYQWDWDNDGTYDATGQNPSHTWTAYNNYMIGLKVTDSQGGEGSATTTVAVINLAPVLSPISNKSVAELDTLNFTATASDYESLTYSLADGTSGSVPTGASIGSTSGIFTWTPSEAQGPNSYTFDVCASDGSLSSCETITVTVSEVNVAPVLDAIGNKNVVELNELSFTASATDEDLPAQILTFSLADGDSGSVPTGASIDGASGTFSWTPTEDQGPGSYTFDVCVNDGELDDCETITVTVYDSIVTHSIALVPGWNLISFYVHPQNTDIEVVLASIDGHYDLVYAWDATNTSDNWLKFDPGVPYGNSLDTLDETMGFWIHMTAADTLDVTGSVSEITPISLSDNAGGWNLVGYPSAANSDLPDVLNGIDFTLVYAYHANDSTDPWKLFDIAAPDWANDLTELSPGWGYWIWVNADETWNVPY